MSTTTFYTLSRPQKVFVVCTAIFLTALVVAEATASKFFTAFELPFVFSLMGEEFTRVTMTAGVIAFPITFIVTDIMNEYFGKKGIRFVTWIALAMIAFEYLLLLGAQLVPVDPISPVSQDSFDMVFGNSQRIIIGSMTAFLLGQFADIYLFHWLRKLTKGKMLWLRATGSTFGSQFIDTLIVLSIAFAGQMTIASILAITLFNYAFKFIIAILITPVIYLAHYLIDQYLGDELAHNLIEEAEAEG